MPLCISSALFSVRESDVTCRQRSFPEVCVWQSIGQRERERELGGAPRQRRETRRRSIKVPSSAKIQKAVVKSRTLVRQQPDEPFLRGHKMKGLPGCLLDLESYVSLLRL